MTTRKTSRGEDARVRRGRDAESEGAPRMTMSRDAKISRFGAAVQQAAKVFRAVCCCVYGDRRVSRRNGASQKRLRASRARGESMRKMSGGLSCEAPFLGVCHALPARANESAAAAERNPNQKKTRNK